MQRGLGCLCGGLGNSLIEVAYVSKEGKGRVGKGGRRSGPEPEVNPRRQRRKRTDHRRTEAGRLMMEATMMGLMEVVEGGL